jgi:hypothetical protein
VNESCSISRRTQFTAAVCYPWIKFEGLQLCAAFDDRFFGAYFRALSAFELDFNQLPTLRKRASDSHVVGRAVESVAPNSFRSQPFRGKSEYYSRVLAGQRA